jgi:hypothetical protein
MRTVKSILDFSGLHRFVLFTEIFLKVSNLRVAKAERHSTNHISRGSTNLSHFSWKHQSFYHTQNQSRDRLRKGYIYP